MKALAEHIDANYKAMSDWYELEYQGDGRSQAARVLVDTTREGLSIQVSTRRPSERTNISGDADTRNSPSPRFISAP